MLDHEHRILPEKGELTWKIEKFISPNAIGLFLAPGYNLSQKPAALIKSDLMAIGLDEKEAKNYSSARHPISQDIILLYMEAKGLYPITFAQRRKLFEIDYSRYEKETMAICHAENNVNIYGKVDWEKLAPCIKAVLVDLHYCNQYSSSLPYIQEHVVQNNIDGFEAVLKNYRLWPTSSISRIQARLELFNEERITFLFAKSKKNNKKSIHEETSKAQLTSKL